jgi:hypothetical protein
MIHIFNKRVELRRTDRATLAGVRIRSYIFLVMVYYNNRIYKQH